MSTEQTTPATDISKSITEVVVKKSSLDAFCKQFGFDQFIEKLDEPDLDLKSASMIIGHYLSKVTEVIISSRTITQRPRDDMQAYFSIDEYSDMFMDYRVACSDFYNNPVNRTMEEFTEFCKKIKKDLDVLRHLLLQADVVLRV